MTVQFLFASFVWVEKVGIFIEKKVLRRIFVLWRQEATGGQETAVYSLY